MTRAIRLRAKADRKARRYTKLLADAIGAAGDAAAQMDALNQLYNVDAHTDAAGTPPVAAGDAGS
jgi:hypothetical protein